MSEQPPRGLLLVTFLGFISLSLPDGMLGVAWPAMRLSYREPISDLGYLVLSATAAYLASSVLNGALLRRLTLSRALGVSSLLVAAGLTLLATGQAWAVALAGAAAVGLGGGTIDAGINNFAAARFSVRLISWLHASFGLGSILSPLLIVGVMSARLSWRWGYTIAIGLEVLLATFFLSFPAARMQLQREDTSGDGKRPVLARDARIVLNRCVAFFLYSGLEVTAGLWAYSALTTSLGVSHWLAGVWVSLYWAALTVGRFLIGGLMRHQGPYLVIGVSIGIAVLATALTCVPHLVPAVLAGLLLLGFSLAPVYPLLILTTRDAVRPELAEYVVGYQVAAAGLGIAILPLCLGTLAASVGLGIFGPSLLVIAVLLALAYLPIYRNHPPVAAEAGSEVP